MPELKRNFTKGRMNKDLDERMVPNGEYREALNIEVGTSEGSNVGAIQTLKGNTNINTGTVLSNLTSSPSLFSGDATCVGSVVDEKSNKLYWFVADSGINYDASWAADNAVNTPYSQVEEDETGTISVTHKVYSDYILEYNDNTKESNWVAVENYKVETTITNDSHSTGTNPGDHLHVSNLGTTGDIRPVGIQVGMDVLVNGIPTSITKIEEDNSGGWSGWRVYTKHTASDNGWGALANVTAGDTVVFELPASKRALGFSHYAATKPDRRITGINIIDDLLFWTDSLTEPKKINIERCRYGSQQANIAAYSSYGTRKYPTLLIVNGSIPSSANHRLALKTSYASAILYPFLSYQHTTVIRKSPTTPLTLTMSSSNSNRLEQGLFNDGALITGADVELPLNNVNGIQSSDFFFETSGVLKPSGATIGPLTFLQTLDWNNGDIIEFYPNDDDAGFENEALVIAQITSSTNGVTFEFEIQSRSTDVIKPFTKWTAKLQQKKPLFEFKFPRFAYRWKYEDGEYSTYSPFSEVAFLPEKFDYLPKKGFNLGMTNNLRYLLLSNFKPITMPLDVIEIDVLYKESNSANVYTVETIKSPSSLVDSLSTVDFAGDDGWFGKVTNQNIAIEAPNTLTTQGALVATNTFEGTVLTTGLDYFGITDDFGETNLKIGDTLLFPNISSGLNSPIVVTGVNSSFTSGAYVSYISLTHGGVAVTPTSGTGNWNSAGTDIELYRDIAKRPAVYIDHPQGSLEVKTDMIHATLPSNQLLRPWDNVPKRALAQDITGNRVVYGNYTQNYDLVDVNNKVVKQKFSVQAGARKNIRENIRYDDRTALRNPTSGVTISWYDALNTIPLSVAQPERSIKSLRDYQIGIVYSDEFGRQTPVQTHETGTFYLEKDRANNYNGINARLEKYSYPEWATHYKYYVKENANEYYNLAMDRFYDAEDGNIWLSFPSSERNKVDEETFLILKKQHDSDVFVSDSARYKILAIENEAPLFVKTVMSSRGVTSIGTFPSTGQPKIDQQHVDVPSGAIPTLDSDKETVIRISNVSTISKYYDVQRITTYGSSKRITVRKAFGGDMSFTTDDGTSTGAIATNLSIEIAQKETKTLPEYEGRFFVKIYKDSVLEKNILVNKPKKQFIATTVMKLGHQDNVIDKKKYWKSLYNTPAGYPVPTHHWFVSHENPQDVWGLGYHRINQGMKNNYIDVQLHWGAQGVKSPPDYGITKFNNNFNASSAELDQATKFRKHGQLWRFKGDTTIYKVTNSEEWRTRNYTKTNGAGLKAASNHSVCLRMAFSPNIGSTGPDAVGVNGTGYDPRSHNAESVAINVPPVADYWSKSKPMNKYDTRTIEFLEEFVGDSSYSSDNPAIWETEPKENVDVDLYNEASMCYPIKREWNPYLNNFVTSTHHNSWNPLSYYNCFSFANGVESNRVRDDYNAVTIDKGPKVSTVLAEQYREEDRKSGLIYSGIYNSTSGINRLNQFIQAEKITKDINPTYGSVQMLWSKDTNLVALCEDRIIGVLANKDALFNADGNSNVTSTNNVLGAATPYAGDYGISTDPESFAIDQYRAYFTDRSRGAVLRLSQNGLVPISDMGMRDYFKDVFRASNLNLVGSYDDSKKLYNLTMQGSDILPAQSGQVSLWDGFATNGNPLGNWTTAGLSDDNWDAWHQSNGTLVPTVGSIAASNSLIVSHMAGMTTTPNWSSYDNAVISSTSGTAGWGGIQQSTQSAASNYDPYPLGEGQWGANSNPVKGAPVSLWFSTWTTGYSNYGHPSYDTTQNWDDLTVQLGINGPGNVYLYMNDPFFVWEPYRTHAITGGLFYPWVGNPALYYTGAWHSDPTGVNSPAKVHQPEACFAIQSIDYSASRKSYEVIGVWLCGETIKGDTQHFQWSLEGPFADDEDDGEGDDLGYTEITASFSEDTSGWTTFKSWLQEFGVSLNDKYFTYNSANLWQHSSNEIRNSFYGVEYDSKVCVVFNDEPSSVKHFSSLSYEGTQSKVTLNTVDGEYYNNIARDGWFASTITSDLETGFIPEFKEKEGKWFNYIMGNKANNLSNLDVAQFSTQGIGRPSTVTTTEDPVVSRHKLTIQDTGDID